MLAQLPGVTLRSNLEDIRSEIARHSVVVLPFVSGAGIKNKLLEAAAMGKAIVCSRRSLLALNGRPPIIVAEKAEDWLEALSGLWLDDQRRTQAGRRNRSWVVDEHGWERPARTALDALVRASPEAR
jgi:glycosyltransferase involved in cell wall biosynthesis